MNKRKVCVVTGSRAEYGLFYPILKKIQESNKLDLQLITTSSHHSSEYGLTYKQIEEAMDNKDSKYYKKYMQIRKSNLHKMKPIPICLFEDD